MKGIVIYYSATGNTAQIAQAIYKGMSTELEVCDIASIRKANPADMAKYDLIVVGGPIWYYRETANLRDFIYNMPDMSGKLCVPFCTHGCGPEGFLFSLSTAIRRKGMTIIGWNDWYGSVYQVLHMPKPYMTDGHPDEIDLKEAEAFGRDMALRARRVAAGEKDLIPKVGTGADRDPLWSVFKFEEKHVPEQGKGPVQPDASMPEKPKFKPVRAVRKFDMNKCTYPACTKCIDNCPINSIDFSVDPPVIKDNCINCALCDKMCPASAIEVNAEAMMQRTQHRINMDKCTYPKCTLCVDYCPMQSIDFSVIPPVFKKNCEGDDLCWVICPNDAIEITNISTTHEPMTMTSLDDHPFLNMIAEAEAKGKFRRLVPLDKVGVNNIIWKNPNAPRFTIDHEPG